MHHKVVPAMIVLIALTFLLNAFNVLDARTTSIVWPVLLLIAGGTKFNEGACKCC
jgi:hypothetical protein